MPERTEFEGQMTRVEQKFDEIVVTVTYWGPNGVNFTEPLNATHLSDKQVNEHIAARCDAFNQFRQKMIDLKEALASAVPIKAPPKIPLFSPRKSRTSSA